MAVNKDSQGFATNKIAKTGTLVAWGNTRINVKNASIFFFQALPEKLLKETVVEVEKDLSDEGGQHEYARRMSMQSLKTWISPERT